VLASAISEPFSVALINATLLASLAISPGLLIAYSLYANWDRRTRGNFYLKKLELIELSRTVLLYEKASRRRREIFREGEHDDLTLLARCHQRYRLKREFADELEELAAYQGHLRSTIIRLRCKPIQRFKSLMHIAFSRFAFGRSLGSYFLSLALLAIGFHFADEPAWAQEMQTGFVSHLLWTPLDARLLYANLMAASVVAVVLPLLYFLQRAKLHGDHRMQLRILKEFAGADPDSLIHQPRADQDWHENVQSDRSAYQQSRNDDDWHEASSAPSPGIADEGTWFDVLGLAPSTTIEEVREAYRLQIKQNHPDRVHGMSPLFRELAEAETKKLNAAYEEALLTLQGT